MLYLIRHAQTRVDSSKPAAEWELDPAGRPALSRLAAARDWDEVLHWYSSPEPKAVTTAAVLTRRAVQQREGLAEVRRTFVGGDYPAVVDRFFSHPDEPAAPGWETAREAQERIVQTIAQLRRAHRGDAVAVVSHGLVLMLFLAHLHKQDRVDLNDWRSVGFPDVAILDGDRVVQRFGAITDSGC